MQGWRKHSLRGQRCSGACWPECTPLVLGAWSGSPSRTPCFPGGLRCQGGNQEVHSGQPARTALLLVGGGGEAGREDGERGAGAGHSGGSLGPGPGASHSRASSPNPSWVLSALIGPPCLYPVVDMCVYRENKSQSWGLSLQVVWGIFFENAWIVVAGTERVDVGL